jgi:hypothetical protein
MTEDLRALCLEIGADLLSRFGYPSRGSILAEGLAPVRA